MSASRRTDAADGEQLIQPLRPLTPTGRAACPYLGLPDDSSTWMAFPSPTNHCHFVAIPGPVDTVHQQGFCLAESYTFCAVLQIDNPRRLPPGVAAPSEKRSSLSKWALLVVLLIIAALALGWLLLPEQRAALLERIAYGGPPEPRADDPAATSGANASGAAPLLTQMTPTPDSSSTVTPSPTVTWTPAPSATRTPEPTEAAPPAAIVEVSVTPTPVLPQAIVDVDLLNVRTGPGVEYPIVAEIERGRQFSVIGRDGSGNWLLVCCFDVQAQGWVFSESVDTVGDVSVAPTVVPPPAP
jgi:hypothetical protein